MYKCLSCNMSAESFFCPNCGRVLRFPRFIGGDKSIEDSLQSYVKAVISKASEKKVNVSAFSDADILSAAAFHKFNEHILFLQKIYANSMSLNCEDGSSVIELLREFAVKCKTNDCHIAVAGRIGSGKSTFISALLGKEIAYKYSNTETSVVTKFRYSEKGDYLKLSYYKLDEWDALWKSAARANQNSIRNDQADYLSEFNKFATDEIRIQLLNREDDVFYSSNEDELSDLVTEYLSNESPSHFFVKEAEIGLSAYPMPKNVVIVDTLGIDDPVSYRVALSNQYLSTSNIILLCVKADDAQLSSYELNEYSYLFSILKDKAPIYIVGTQYDIPQEFTKYWNEKTDSEFIRLFSAKSYYGSTKNIEGKLLHVSAWYYNVIQSAKNDAAFWDNEYNVDYLAEVLCRCLGTSIAYQYGTDANSLKKCMKEHLEELESTTNMPPIIDYIKFGPVRDFERNGFKDFRDIYLSICNKKSVTDCKHQPRYSSKLLYRMKELDSKIIRKHNEAEVKGKAIRALLRSIQNSNQ